MATPIKIIPTLRGDVARSFIERAQRRESSARRAATPIYSDKEMSLYRKMLKESRMQND